MDMRAESSVEDTPRTYVVVLESGDEIEVTANAWKIDGRLKFMFSGTTIADFGSFDFFFVKGHRNVCIKAHGYG